MPRVTIRDSSIEQFTAGASKLAWMFVLEGQITEPWVADLESAWNGTRESVAGESASWTCAIRHW